MNKKNTLILVTALAGLSLKAQEPAKKDSAWKINGFFSLNVSQTTLSDWQGGGQNNLTIGSLFNLDATWKKGKEMIWTNKLDAQYGLIRQGTVRTFRKNTDQLFALSKFNKNAFAKNLFYSAQADFRTQFAPGYTYDGETIVGSAGSDFMSPGYLQLALGIDYKPAAYFSAMIAPAAGKITFVSRQYLADAGAYGVDKAVYDATTGALLTPGKKMRSEFGGRVVLKFKKDIYTNVNLDSYLDLFSNYTNNPGNIDVVFNNLLTFKISKYFTANVLSQLIYDDDIVVKRDANKDGYFETDGPRLQALTTISFGLGFKF